MSYKTIIPPQYNFELNIKKTYFRFDEGILTSLNFSFEDLCDLYNLSMSRMKEKNDFLIQKIKENPYPSDINHEKDFQLLRINESINQQSDKLNTILSFSNQVTSVYAWVLIEQTENKLINLIEKKKKSQDHDGYSDWKRRKQFFKVYEIKIDGFEKYFDVVELQKFNNKMKHLGKVDKELSELKTFRGKENYPLECVTIPVETYINNAYLYMIELFIEIENKIFPETK